mgnify:CR=1 FL=1
MLVNQPCFCLCFGFSQITIIFPFLLMILHFSQIFLTDGFTFIVPTVPFLLCCGAAPSVARTRGSFRTPCDASLCQVVNRHFNGHAVTGQYLDIIHSQLAGNMRCHHMSVRELDPEARVRERFHDHAFKLDDIILLCQNNPSLPAT